MVEVASVAVTSAQADRAHLNARRRSTDKTVPIMRASTPGDASVDAPQLQVSDLPVSYQAADSVAILAERNHLRVVRAQIGCALVAVVAGVIAGVESGLRWVGLVGTAALVVLVVLHLLQRTGNLQRAWLEARAAAEAAKSLAWRYSVAGPPFDRTDAIADEVDREFLGLLREMTLERALSMAGPPAEGVEISNAMRRLRNSPLEVRKRAYEEGRIADQQAWCALRARRNARAATRADALFFGVSAVAITGGVWSATSSVAAGILALAGAGAAATLEWIGLRRYRTLSGSYTALALQLGGLRSVLAATSTPPQWAALVDAVEQALRREQEAWRATRA
jgi:SMODS and SLOG-associating 2TM effector domain 3/SMODS and SLOG-associating 2TM effector domain 1